MQKLTIVRIWYTVGELQELPDGTKLEGPDGEPARKISNGVELFDGRSGDSEIIEWDDIHDYDYLSEEIN